MLEALRDKNNQIGRDQSDEADDLADKIRDMEEDR